MLLSVCIVNWNTRDLLRDCLASLEAHPPTNASMETIVVDNASHDGSADMVATEFPTVTLVRIPTNTGYAEGSNIAFSHISGDLVLLLNPDIVIHPGALTRAVAYMLENPAVGAMGCRLLSPDGSTQRSLRSFPDPWPVLYEYTKLARHFPRSRTFAAYRMDYFDYDHPGEVDQPMMSFLMVSRRCLDDVGPMDPVFPIFFNDVDWCYRAKRHKGWRIMYIPWVAVTHHHGSSTKQAPTRMVRESHRSMIRFYEKHYRRQMPAWLFAVIRWAIQIDEWRVLRRAKG